MEYWDLLVYGFTSNFTSVIAYLLAVVNARFAKPAGWAWAWFGFGAVISVLLLRSDYAYHGAEVGFLFSAGVAAALALITFVLILYVLNVRKKSSQ